MIFGNYFKIYRNFLNARKNLESFCTSVPSEELNGEALSNFRFAQDYAYFEILGKSDKLLKSRRVPGNVSLEDYRASTGSMISFLNKVAHDSFDEPIKCYD